MKVVRNEKLEVWRAIETVCKSKTNVWDCFFGSGSQFSLSVKLPRTGHEVGSMKLEVRSNESCPKRKVRGIACDRNCVQIENERVGSFLGFSLV